MSHIRMIQIDKKLEYLNAKQYRNYHITMK